MPRMPRQSSKFTVSNASQLTQARVFRKDLDSHDQTERYKDFLEIIKDTQNSREKSEQKFPEGDRYIKFICLIGEIVRYQHQIESQNKQLIPMALSLIINEEAHRFMLKREILGINKNGEDLSDTVRKQFSQFNFFHVFQPPFFLPENFAPRPKPEDTHSSP